MDEGSREVLGLAEELLGPDGFAARSVPYEEVAPYYRAADCVVLASLREGFGRVFLEALMHRLPVVAHEHPVMAYVLDGEGSLGNLERAGELARLLSSPASRPGSGDDRLRRWPHVKDRFGWEALTTGYVRMVRAAARRPIPAEAP
jgi:1,2-diacylglycerol 3-alpha-glucosyltransferase